MSKRRSDLTHGSRLVNHRWPVSFDDTSILKGALMPYMMRFCFCSPDVCVGLLRVELGRHREGSLFLEGTDKAAPGAFARNPRTLSM